MVTIGNEVRDMVSDKICAFQECFQKKGWIKLWILQRSEEGREENVEGGVGKSGVRE